MRYAVGGTILEYRLALEHGLAVNLGGGYRHAASDWGGGFCVYADVPLAVKLPHDEGEIERVLVVDLDAHQGNGTAAVFRQWPWAAIYDLFERDIFPARKEPEDFPPPVGPGLPGAEHLGMMRDTPPGVLDAARPDRVVYDAGSDPFVGDSPDRHRLGAGELVGRDLLVVDMAREWGIPVALGLSGGYSAESWKIHAVAMEGVPARFDRATSSEPRRLALGRRRIGDGRRRGCGLALSDSQGTRLRGPHRQGGRGDPETHRPGSFTPCCGILTDSLRPRAQL